MSSKALQELIVRKFRQQIGEGLDEKELSTADPCRLLKTIFAGFTDEKIYYDDFINTMLRQNAKLKQLQNNLRIKLNTTQQYILNQKQNHNNNQPISKFVQMEKMAELNQKLSKVQLHENLINILKSKIEALEIQVQKLKKQQQRLVKENSIHKFQISEQQTSAEMYGQQIELLKKKMENRQIEHDNDIVKYKDQFAEQLKEAISKLKSTEIKQLQEDNKGLRSALNEQDSFVKKAMQQISFIFNIEKRQPEDYDYPKILSVIQQKINDFKTNLMDSIQAQSRDRKSFMSNLLTQNKNKLMARNYRMNKYL